MNRRSWSVVNRLIRWILAGVFLYAGIAKFVQSPAGFADSIASFRLLPTVGVVPMALALPPFELLAGAALLIEYPRRLGACAASLLGAVFLVALALAMARGITVDCGCFGAGAGWLPLSSSQRMWFDLVRDGLIVATALFLYRQEMAVTYPRERNQ